jgi:hypothetical protein
MKQSTLSHALHLLILGTVALLGIVAPRALAQGQPDELVALSVELWPDYDQPSMLVLMTGTLAAATPLPATVTIPLPPGATIHAVARPTADNRLVSDVVFTTGDDALTLTLTDPRFHVEYYAPMQTDGDQRRYDFRWQNDLAVAQLSPVVQQPLAAEGFSVVPEPVNVSSDRGDGLLYHSLPSQAVAAGEPFDITVSYTSTTGALSAPALAVQPPPGAGDAAQPAATAGSGGLFDGFNPLWLLVIFGVAALVGLAFYFGRQQATAPAGRPRKPAPSRPPKTAAKPPVAPTPPAAQAPAATPPPAPPPAAATGKRFCHQCGEPAEPGDRFCRNCGTQLKAAS